MGVSDGIQIKYACKKKKTHTCTSELSLKVRWFHFIGSFPMETVGHDAGFHFNKLHSSEHIMI